MNPASPTPGPGPRPLGDFLGGGDPGSRGDEFLPGSTVWPRDLDRRAFLKLAAASTTLAGLGACARRPGEAIVPYVVPPDYAVQEDAVYYASAADCDGFARGILVETHFGRPTKIEGHPRHAESQGATDLWTQAEILGLYDPDRAPGPARRGEPEDWENFGREWRARQPALEAAGGAGLAILAEPTTSPTFRRELRLLLEKFPQARWYQHTALGRPAGPDGQVDADWEKADVVLAVGGDALFRHPAALRWARGHAARRRVEGGCVALNRFYAIESTPTVTGTLADFRLPASPRRLRRVLTALGAHLDGAPLLPPEFTAAESHWIGRLAADLRRSAPAVLCLAGPEQPPDIQRWALALNARCGALGRTATLRPPLRSDDDPRSAGDLAALRDSLAAGTTRSLLILGGNPAYASGRGAAFAAQVAALEFSAHVSGYADETSRAVQWHLPASHFLETWGDLLDYRGAALVQQPMIEPLHATRSAAEVLRWLRTGLVTAGYEIVRDTWREKFGATFEATWQAALADGGGVPWDIAGPGRPAPPGLGLELALPPGTPAELSIVLPPDPGLLDGRWANHPWLQELARPVTHLVWDNAALVAPALARARGLQNGDVVEIRVAGAAVAAPVWIVPGQAADCLALHLGAGRRSGAPNARGSGVDAYPLRGDGEAGARDLVSLRRTGDRRELVATHAHFSLEGRDLVRSCTPPGLAEFTATRPPPSLFADWPVGRHAWGMVIDLSTCLGCSACVLACQAENNIPCVGREQVARGREMHWIRVDRYFEGDLENPRSVVEPVACMHCERAPCELVCPVAATTHSSEGLNQMVYNRCVGTRYCSNNCPYKVRRFNFLDYRAPADSPLHLQENPGVTVRERGVMEKCTYCVQRIAAVRIRADREDRPIRDGEVIPACAQACPTQAITFGDLADPGSRVSARRREPGHFALLEEQNTRPRTTYLARVRQPDPARPPA